MKLTGELCECGHDRAWHHKSRKDKQETLPCVAMLPASFDFCSCTNFKTYKGEGTPMPKAKAKRIARKKGEARKARVQKLYAFDVERARKLRDEDYKGKDSVIALTLRGLIEKNKEVLTFEQIADAATSAGVKRADRNTLPMKLLKKNKVLKPTKETAEVASTQKSAEKPKSEKKKRAPVTTAPKAKRVSKPKAKKEAAADDAVTLDDNLNEAEVAEAEVAEAEVAEAEVAEVEEALEHGETLAEEVPTGTDGKKF